MNQNMEQKFFQKFVDEETENFLIKCKNNKLIHLSVEDEAYRKFEDEEVRKAVIRYKIEKSEFAKKLKDTEPLCSNPFVSPLLVVLEELKLKIMLKCILKWSKMSNGKRRKQMKLLLPHLQ